MMEPPPNATLPQDRHDEVDALLRAAFGGPAEAELVRRLRADRDLFGEHVLVEVTPARFGSWTDEGRPIAAYAALARMRAPEGWCALAPLAVHPRWQGGVRGDRTEPFHVGSELAGLMAFFGRFDRDRPEWPRAVVVLGSVPFYERAGFSAARARNLRSAYPIEHTLLAAPGDDAPEAALVYPPAFEDL